MNAVRRTRGIKKVLRLIIIRKPVQKYVTAGDLSCRKMMQAARSRHQACPSDQAILAWARYDLFREIMNGFWEYQTA